MRMMVLALVMAAGVAEAKQPLEKVESVTDGLLWVGIADEIRKTCPTISARMIRALGYINDIQNEAKSLGYSKAEIDTFRKSDANKAELRRRGEAYLKANGVDLSDPSSYCTLGLAEIKKSSQIGALLRAN
ncbi:MAG: DUF5333 domain-containing protein [Cognatishimia sp.]|uniref:DUF5333 domain-containing protein n=1 Tax=Cognatishimia sp. 1_MG-2023 TaxID=3062642 RepID=UPI0026E396E2|nr:DUF5333 domain-containing protein [Cognatishimia sp. 1_MG-2023]MDO6725566.1 DUF5333 domain-containing protein [Cognatishimia sp. 1_MG-2023]